MKLRLPSGSTISIQTTEPQMVLQGVPIEPEPIWEHPVPKMESQIQEALSVRGRHIEIMAGAFLKEVGSSRASEYQLIEEWGDKKIKWRFERIGI